MLLPSPSPHLSSRTSFSSRFLWGQGFTVCPRLGSASWVRGYRHDSTQLLVHLWGHWIPSASRPFLSKGHLSSCAHSLSGLFLLSLCLLLCTMASFPLLDSRVASCWAQSQGWSSEVSSFFIGSLVHPSQGSPALLLLSTACIVFPQLIKNGSCSGRYFVSN